MLGGSDIARQQELDGKQDCVFEFNVSQNKFESQKPNTQKESFLDAQVATYKNKMYLLTNREANQDVYEFDRNGSYNIAKAQPEPPKVISMFY